MTEASWTAVPPARVPRRKRVESVHAREREEKGKHTEF
jgi:hypothetical protein